MDVVAILDFLSHPPTHAIASVQAYGVRVYKNGSTLVNHVDRSETHVVSCIFHLGHDLDEPWPLEIEDHDGTVHAVMSAALYQNRKHCVII